MEMKGSDLMKKTNALAVCSILLAVILLFSGCASVIQNFENEDLRQYTESMLDAVIANDSQAAYSLVSNICTEADFALAFTQMHAVVGNADTYTLKLLHVSTNHSVSSDQTISTSSAIYEMTTDLDRIIVSVSANNQVGLCSFFLTPYEQTDYYSTGTVTTMRGATFTQWLFLLSNLISVGITVFALVDCCRHTIRKKALWILLLIFGFVSLGATVSATSFQFNFNVSWLMAYSALIRYGSGTIMIRFMLPVGAICYFIARQSLLRASVPETSPEAPVTEEEVSAQA